MVMSTPNRDDGTDSGSDTYGGRPIAAFRHGMGWLVFIDQVMQANGRA
jgi:hypothetical protein